MIRIRRLDYKHLPISNESLFHAFAAYKAIQEDR